MLKPRISSGFVKKIPTSFRAITSREAWNRTTRSWKALAARESLKIRRNLRLLKAIIAREFLNNLLNLRFLIGLVLRETVTRLYLTILSRFPTDEELGVVDAYRQAGEAKGPQVLQDVAWALINSAEFLYRH